MRPRRLTLVPRDPPGPPPTARDPVARILRIARADVGLSRRAVAQRSGVPLARVTALEAGAAAAPSELLALMHVLVTECHWQAVEATPR